MKKRPGKTLTGPIISVHRFSSRANSVTEGGRLQRSNRRRSFRRGSPSASRRGHRLAVQAPRRKIRGFQRDRNASLPIKGGEAGRISASDASFLAARPRRYEDKEASSMSRGALPTKNDAWPVGNVTFRIGKDAFPIEPDASPTRNDALRTEKEARPHDKDATPTEGNALPIGNAALPSELDAESMRNDALPIERAAFWNQPGTKAKQQGEFPCPTRPNPSAVRRPGPFRERRSGCSARSDGRGREGALAK
jgi:hypothetical protein